jgi:hypothetical protein
MYPRIDRLAALARPLLLALALVPLALSRAAASQIMPPLIRALANGQTVDTIATEASDAATADALGVTLAPPLSGAIGIATSARYEVTNFRQPDVLSQIPTPPGPGNSNANYSPLWQVNLVTWKSGTTPAQLGSEADVMAAQTAGKVTVTPTSIVINGPVVSTPSGSILPLGTLDGFAEGDDVQNIITDTNDQGFASVSENKANNANYAPKLSNLSGSSAVLDLYKFSVAGVFNNPANPNQLTFFDTHPQPVGPHNGNGAYTPMWSAVAVQFTAKEPMPFPVITSSDQLDAEEANGDMTESDTGIIVDCPIIGVEGKANQGNNGQGNNGQGNNGQGNNRGHSR